ncbi:MAG TPA: SprB repeat-containing protein [Bacteroidia bacterium]|jgi:uncharacterized protein YggE|nr:SprB repeat-containing protein [Bacteroidia bacterium]
MKKIMTILTLFSAAILSAQEQGNFQSATSTSGNFDAVNAITNTTTAATCFGNANGSATVTANGGNAYDYSWNTTNQTRQYYNPYTGQYENAPVAGKDNASAALPYDNTVIFDADVMFNVRASSYTAIFSTTDFGTTALSADSALSSRIKIFLDGLKGDSIRDEDIHIDFITMLPVYQVEAENRVFSNIATEVPAGFKIKKNVHILFYDHRKLDHIITAAAKAGIYDLVKVDYNVNNIEAAYDSLRKVAVGVIDMKRKTYADMGFTTTIMTMAEGYDSKYPDERYASYTAYVQDASGQNITAENPNIQIRTADKEQTVFYNKVPYKQFDKVLNADLAEPGVQFYYKLRVKCKMEVKVVDPPKTTVPKTAAASTTVHAATTSMSTAAGTYQPEVHVTY